MLYQIPQFVSIFVKMFSSILSKPQLIHLGMFLTQRMLCSPKQMTVRKLKSIFLKPKSTNASNEFLNNKTIWDSIKEKRKEILVKKFYSKKGALIIDDTLCYKTGKKMHDIFCNFCHVIGKKILSHVIVTSVYKTPKYSIGFDFKKYIPEKIAQNFKTKYELAYELILDAYNRNLISRVYFDSWFCQPKLLRLLKHLNLEFFGMFRIGTMKVRSVKTYKTLKQFVAQISEDKYRYRKIKGRKRTYKVKFYREIVFIKHLGKINIVVAKKYDQNKKTYNEPRVYATNVLNLRALDVIRTYLNRWDVEMFHKTVKQSYGFEDYQATKAQAQNACFELAFLSDMLLHFKRLNWLRLHRASMKMPCTIKTEKVCSEDLILNALSAQKKGTLKEFLESCNFNSERFKYYI